MSSIHRPASRFALCLAALAGLMACERAPTPEGPPQPEVARTESAQGTPVAPALAPTLAPTAPAPQPKPAGHNMYGQTFEDAVRDAQS